MKEKIIPIGEAAEVLNVSVDTVRRYDKLGILHSVRPGGKVRYFSIEELTKVKNKRPDAQQSNSVDSLVPSKQSKSGVQKIALTFLKTFLIIFTALTVLFLLFPDQTAKFLTLR